ncbi:DUF1302 domain-containing protein [Derxia lacustris]|uniref:DUF1302 domain-containing protein n=1 Tax=Derxia lacustris TaxID=764842 RepID=UPI001593288C|nr:DUF1302 domain-containing protein [Derxia lacustris]
MQTGFAAEGRASKGGADLPRRRPALAPLGIALAAAFAAPAHAADFELDGFRIKTTAALSAGSAWRTTDRDPVLLPAANATLAGVDHAATHGRNQDDGNLNFDRGDRISTMLKAYGALDAERDGLGLHLSAKAWTDRALADDEQRWGNWPAGYAGAASHAQRLDDGGFDRRARFSGAVMQEASVSARGSLDGHAAQARAGWQTLDWGRGFAIAGGLSGINPVDLPASRRPGALPEEVAIPIPLLLARIDPTPATTLEGFWQLGFAKTVLDGCGTFFAGADYVADGCNGVMVGDAFTDPASVAAGRYLKRQGSPGVARDGQFGASLRWRLPELKSEIGFYAAQAHSRTPLVSPVKTGRSGGAPFVPGNADGLNAGYLTEYPEDIRMFGISFARRADDWTLAAEASYRPNQPMQLNSVDLLNAVASVTAPTLLRADVNALAPGAVLHGYDRHKASQLQVAATVPLRGLLPGDPLALGAEAGVKFVHDLPDATRRRYGRSDVFGVGTVNGVCADVPLSCANAGYVSRTSWGYRLRAGWRTPVADGITVAPSLAWAQDLRGWSHDGAFSQGRRAIVTGLRAELRQRWSADLTWNQPVGGSYNQLRDRGWAAIALGARF